MPKPRNSSNKRDREFRKRDREQAKREKATLKRDRRENKSTPEPSTPDVVRVTVAGAQPADEGDTSSALTVDRECESEVDVDSERSTG